MSAADDLRAELLALQSGLAHLRDHHPEIVWAAGGDMYAPTVGTYCRAHGTRRDACGCGVAHRDPEPLIVAPGRAGEARTGDYGPEGGAQRFDLSHDCATCGSSSIACDQYPSGCCSACSATGGCTHDNPLHTAHNLSREDC